MNVSGIRPYEGFYQYNSIKLNELRGQQIAASANAAEAVSDAVDTVQKPEAVQSASMPVNQSFDSYDFAQQYRPDETFQLKGEDSSIESLDAKKAVSDLEKDQILQQYQYFVGDKVHAGAQEDSLVKASARLSENFFL
jgi:hypothetical protein